MATRSDSLSPRSPLSPMLSPFASSEKIIFESFLCKTPPLKSFIMKWSKRWFVLSTTDPADPNSIQLCYYKDETMRDTKRVVDLSKFVGIRPSAKVGNHRHVFAIETQERKFILKADDAHTKNIWLAKLCELFGQESVCHVSVPQQPSCTYSEAILKLSCPSHLTILTPSTGSPLLEVPFEEVRRIGSMDAYGTDIVWVETCKNSLADNFIFFSIPSGHEMGQEVVRELKTAIESHTSIMLIMEVSSEAELSFISRDHYGCPEFPTVSRNAIIHSGLSQSPVLWQNISMGGLRRESDSTLPIRSPSADTGGMSLDEWSAKRNKRKAHSMKGPSTLTRRPTLEHFARQTSLVSFDPDHNSPDRNEVFSPPPNAQRPRKHSLCQQNSSSSLTSSHRSQPPSLTHQSSSSSLTGSPPPLTPRKYSLSHQNSSSSLTNSTPSPPCRTRKLSYQSSVNSHSSGHSAHSGSPQATSVHNSMNSLDLDMSGSFTYSAGGEVNAPAVPPRSDVSLRDAYACTPQLTAAH